MGQHKTNPMAIAAAKGLAPQRQNHGAVNLDLSKMAKRTCKDCGSEVFEQEIRFLEVPELMRFATKGQDTIVLQTYVCKGCGISQPIGEMTVVPPEKEGAD